MLPEGVPRAGFRPMGLPSSEEIRAPLRAAGIVDNPRIAPQSPLEHYVDRAGEVAGASIPFGARGMFSGAVSGLTSEAARQFGAGPWGQLGAALVGGVGGSAIYGVGERLINSVFGRLNEVGQAYRTAGITPRMVGDVSGSPIAQRLQNAAAGLPGGTGMTARAADRTLNDFTQAIDRAASRYGSARSPEQAGEALQAGARDWLQNWRAASGEAWDRVLRILPEDAPIPVTNLRSAVNAVGQRMRDVPDVARALSSDRFTALREAINRSPAEWRSESVRAMRTIIGQLNEAKGIVGDSFTAELDQLYGALSQDIRLAVAMRPGGMPAWTQANRITSQGHRIVDSIVNPLVREGATPTDAYRFAVSQVNARTGGGARVSDVANVTGAGGEVASSLLSQAGQRVAESRTPATFSQLTDPRSSYGLAPEAAGSLFGQPGSRDRRLLEALDQVARSSRATGQFANTSRTAPTSMLMNYIAGTVPAAVGLGGGAAAGSVPWSVAGPAIGAAVGAPVAGYLGALATTNRPLAAYLAARSTAPSFGQGLLNQLIQQDLARHPALALSR